MQNKKTFFTFLLLIFSICTVKAQLNCPSNFDYEKIKKFNPTRYDRLMNYEKNVKAKTSRITQNARLIDNNGVIVIPVVVHVLYNADNPDQNISDARIYEQIQVLNEDFRRLNSDAVNTPSDFLSRAADLKYEFKLACIDEQGLPTNGIVRKQVSTFIYPFITHPDGRPNEDAIGIKRDGSGDKPWDTDSYLNIWTCFISGQAGYSTFPEDFAAYRDDDGVVLSCYGVGKNLQGKGRTATHEIGHWLGLKHIFEGGCSSLIGDGVRDTPSQLFQSSYLDDIPSLPQCLSYPQKLFLYDPSEPSTMFMNYMDYMYGECQNLFTIGQSNKSRGNWNDITRRGSHLNNYFRILPFNNSITCIGSIYLRNPACLPVTWSVVSGPITIFSGQGTNSLTIKTTSSGTAVIRATSGNYESDITVNVIHASGPTISGTFTNTSGTQQQLSAIIPRRNIVYNEICTGVQIGLNMNITAGSSITWSLVTGNPNFNLSQSGNNAIVYFSHGAEGETAVLNVSATNECGTKSFNYAFKGKYCTGWQQLKVSPNPATSYVNISFDKSVKFVNEIKSILIKQILIIDKAGHILRKYDFTIGLKDVKINLTNLKSDLYSLQVFDGEKWITSKIIVQ
jgi:hypothetical protein